MKKVVNNKFYILIILVVIIVTIFLMSNNKLVDFKITSVEDVDGVLTVICEKQSNAIKYVARIYKDGNLINSFDSDTNRVPITIDTIKNGDDVNIVATVFNKNDDTKDSSEFTYTYGYPTFTDNTSLIITKSRLFTFNIKGPLDDTYKIDILYQNNIVHEINDVASYVNLDYNDISKYKGKLTANLINKKGRIVSSFNFYNDPVMVGDVKIISPSTYTVQKSDIILAYEGGENATSVSLYIMEGNKIIKEYPINNEDKVIRIPEYRFIEDNTYKLKVVASYNDYQELAKSDEIDINISSNNKVFPPYIDHYESKIKKGTLIELKTKTDGAIIKYTLNGTDPKKYGVEYHDPIVINNDLRLSTYAYRDGLDDSEIINYDFKIDNTKRVIYLSPSSQNLNYGVSKVGYTTEMAWMNKVCDVVENKLKEYDVKVLRNNPKVEGKMNVWLAESRKAKSDLHIALHSNGSVEHNEQGMEVWVDNEYSLAYSFANVLYDNLYDIYPYKSGSTNRGIKYAMGSLGEVNPLNISRGVLIEIAFHDDYNDAKWIVDNYVKIGENIAKSIIDFYQIGG